MRNLLFAIVMLAACGDDKGKADIDAPVAADAAIDAPVMIDAPPGTPSCAAYCTAIMANCTAGVQQYANATDCMNSCMNFPVGTGADTTTNTLGCRQYHAGLAQAAPNTHCVHAGPAGDGACGALCEGFCSIALARCPTQAPNANQCANACAGYATTGTPYNQSIQSGNTRECRLYHVTAASTSPNVHCPHIGQVSVTCN